MSNRKPTVTPSLPVAAPSVRETAGAAPRTTRIATLRAMLESPEGTNLDAMRSATGWQPHSVRAAISSLRKSGMAIERYTPADNAGNSVYRAIQTTGGTR